MHRVYLIQGVAMGSLHTEHAHAGVFSRLASFKLFVLRLPGNFQPCCAAHLLHHWRRQICGRAS